MSDLFESLNNVVIDFDDYEVSECTYLETKQIRKRMAEKFKNNRQARTRHMITAAMALVVFSFGFVGIANNPGVLANIPLIGATLEEYVDSNRPSLQDYKVVIGKTVEDNGIEIQLNEVLLDNGRLVVSSTFRSSTVDLARVSMTPTVYINGKKTLNGAHGSMEEIDDSTCISYQSMDLENINMDEMLDIRLSYNEMFYTDTGKRVKGNWNDFEFTATGQKLIAETRTIVINKKLNFEDGQEIIVKDLIISPFSTTLNYSSRNGTEHISFEIEDQDGNRQYPNRAVMLSENSYNRFEQKSLGNSTRVTIIPMQLTLETGNYKAFPDKAFEVIINGQDSN